MTLMASIRGGFPQALGKLDLADNAGASKSPADEPLSDPSLLDSGESWILLLDVSASDRHLICPTIALA